MVIIIFFFLVLLTAATGALVLFRRWGAAAWIGFPHRLQLHEPFHARPQDFPRKRWYRQEGCKIHELLQDGKVKGRNRIITKLELVDYGLEERNLHGNNTEQIR